MSAYYASSVKEYLSKLKDDHRYRVEPSIWASNPKLVEVNLDKLRIRFHEWLYSSFLMWDKLDDILTGRYDSDDESSHNPIRDGCESLAVTMVQQLYALLAHKTSIRLGHSSPMSQLYESNQIYLTEIPVGCAYIIEQFGQSQKIQDVGNYNLLHVWDGEYKETQGVNPKVCDTLQQYVGFGFLDSLRSAGVQMRKINLDCPERSAWDAFYIDDEGHGCLSFSTVYPIQHYRLPRDIFLAYAFCGPHESEALYGPHEYAEAVKFFSKTDKNQEEDSEVEDINAAASRKKRKCTKGISSVGRSVRKDDALAFFRLLFRKGMD